MGEAVECTLGYHSEGAARYYVALDPQGHEVSRRFYLPDHDPGGEAEARLRREAEDHVEACNRALRRGREAAGS